MKRQNPKSGDVFVIPLGDDAEALGQVVSIEPDAMNSFGCIFWPFRDTEVLRQIGTKPVAGLLVTPDQLKSGRWPIIANESVRLSQLQLPYEKFRPTAWVGAKIIGSRIIVEFMRAWRGLWYWDEWVDPQYLDGLLLPGTSVPSSARFKNGS